MQRETIERLAMDQTLGELSEDAAILFEAYLSEHPEVQPWARQMSETCELARVSIGQKTRALRTARPAGRIRSSRPASVNWAALGRWAAVVAIALSVGSALGRWSKPTVVVSGSVVASAEPPAAQEGWPRVVGQSQEGFWQAKAVAMLDTKSYPVGHTQSSAGGLWDRYRRFTKERRYE